MIPWSDKAITRDSRGDHPGFEQGTNIQAAVMEPVDRKITLEYFARNIEGQNRW